jgi:pimeloyl-ACP methyl ester carboxylesterase
VSALPITYALIPGAGGSAWYWHRVVPLLTAAGADAVAVELPAADEAADLSTYADTVCRAVADVTGPLVVVGQSMGAFTAPIVADRLAAALLVLVNPMVPMAGEAPGQWWEATGQKRAMVDNFRRIGHGDKDFDMFEDFFHDVPDDVRDEAMTQGEPPQSDTPFERPWPLDRWPDVPTSVIQGSDDRLFPLEFQRRVVRDRLGLDVDVIPGGHLVSLSRPTELTDRLLAHGAGAPTAS